jgi:hypothetical protein
MSKPNNEIEQLVVDTIKQIAKSHEIEPHSVGFNDFQSYCKEHNIKLTNDLRWQIRAAGGFSSIKDKHYPEPITKEQLIMAKEAKLAKEQAINGVLYQDFLARFKEISGKLIGKKFTFKPNEIHKSNALIDREVNILISDTHFGINLPGTDGPIKYGPRQEARRLAQVVDQVLSYKLHYRDNTVLRVHLAGDIIQGQLHDLRDGKPLAEQSAAAIYLLTQAITAWAGGFRKVIVDCVSGNHGRNTSRHPDRATNEKWDSIETIIYYGIKQAVAHLPNVEFFIPRTPFVEFDSFGNKVFGTHGDSIFQPISPNSTINVGALESQVNRINATKPHDQRYKLFFIGHVHTGAFVQLQSGAKLITNGALVPPDNYAFSIGLMSGVNGQTLWESVPGFVAGDYRFLYVDEHTDKDKALDTLIKPFKDF